MMTFAFPLKGRFPMVSVRKMNRFLILAVVPLVLAFVLVAGCSSQPKTPQDAWSVRREEARQSEDPAEVADWLLAELLEPGGSAAQAKAARKRLDEIGADIMTAHLGRGLYDVSHGYIKRAADEFFLAILAARTSEDERADLVAWYAAIHVLELYGQTHDFGERHREDVALLLREPKNIGFRAYAKIVDLWAKEAFAAAQENVEERIAERLGCAQHLRIAGPFGTGQASDHLRSFPAEKPGPWPQAFPQGEGPSRPRQIETESYGCDVEADEVVREGIFYGESYLELEEQRELILTASGATKIWVDDQLVLERDVRSWGNWPRFGTRVTLAPGRHRVLWKMGDAATALRIMKPDGRPSGVATSRNAGAGYDVVGPQVGPDPNAIMAYIEDSGVKDPGDALTRYLAAFLANHEGEPDVATVLLEPLVEKPSQATGTSLAVAASFVVGDPIYDKNQTRELVHELEVRASEHDPGLWYPRLRVALWDANQRGLTEAVRPLEELVAEFPEVATLHNTLARVYEELGWGPELERTVARVTQQFPKDPAAIELGIELAEEQGKTEKVDVLLQRLRKEDPDSDVFVQRALERQDYQAALKELRRLAARRPSRKDLVQRIEDVMVRAGNTDHVLTHLKEAIAEEPRDVHSRLALADAKLARGEEGALAKALVRAVEADADPSLIEDAIDLIEGVTELEPYRIDALEVIEKYEQSGKEHPGTAVRVLDYGAVLVRSDGSSRFLEHEVVRVQSEEGIKKFTELDTRGHTLHLRVIKKDGTILEPQAVSGKPTVTMPHLEVGDYVEQERILSQWGDGVGEKYLGPSWFFREQNVAYARSEFAVIAPASKEIQLEMENGVPKPEIRHLGSQVLYHFRVDDSPAAPVEPHSPPPSEFLPRVSVGWGLSFEDRIRETSRSMVSLTPVDPRITRIAENIVRGKKKDDISRARALYHWVLDSVQEGEETDGRRVIVSRSGNRWKALTTLCRAIGIPVRWALAESRLSSPISGPVSSSQRPLMPLLVVGEGEQARWLTIADRFAPFGTVPGPLRGEQAYLLGGLEPERATVPEGGARNVISYEGRGKLRKDGSARLSLRIIFQGQFAASLRNGLSQIPENQLPTIIESRLLGQELKGAELLSHEVIDRDQLDRPLVIAVEVDAPQLATQSSRGLLLGPPFMPRLGGLTPLAERATPLLISDSSGQSLDLKIELPEGARATVQRASADHPRSRFEVQDQAEPGMLHLVRDLRTKAGRIAPSDYQAFRDYTRKADAALSSAIRIR